MKIPALILVLGMGSIWHCAAGEEICPTNAPAVIALRDQFEVMRTLKFPTTNLTFLTIADKAGSEQIAAWVAPVQQRFGEQVAIEGIADVSSVPRPFREMVRRKFKKAQSHPVMLDWSGDTVKAFAASADQANVFVLDHQGKILKRLRGRATKQSLEELCVIIEQALADAKKRVASP